MIRYIFFTSILFSFIFISCKEDFDPRAEFKPKYIMSCILRGDTTYQTLTLTSSYSVNGYDPYENTTDPSLDGADIRLWQKDSVYFFKDSIVARIDTSRYKTPVKFYYIKNFKPAENIALEIRAVTNNGKALFASTILPGKISWDTSSNFLLPPVDKDKFLFQWVPAISYGWYILKYHIRYKNTALSDEILTKEVPLRYNGNTPEYPKLTKRLGYEFENAALQRAFTEISEGDPNKSNYTIYGGIIELLIFDRNLSKYYSSINGFVDDFTVRVDQTDYSNIEGGYGIFGSYLKQLSGTAFREDYIRSFGYKLN